MTIYDPHAVQKAYRKLIDSLSKPGTINILDEFRDSKDIKIPCNDSTYLFMQMLLDTEVTFHILGQNSETISKYVSQITYAKSAPLHEADFIFLLQNREAGQLVNAIEQCKSGELINPHQSATLIVEVEKISKEEKYQLKGPGIETVQFMNIYEKDNWIEARAQKNINYPIGIDIYFLDPEARLLALPRTTIIDGLT
ncbi:phosphonate C-P lyase system protein PhnH [Heliorestis acidaminivorans]|uniref:Phosphonate C-P lyase system protein PhnH n=1 Tax=Heliorestis acidaminivorans TaxID=553427 RepID=A0A6I0ESH5_9FIRM|nr:phosphonate C-P lyase system protein PhnH [Heliorestis acidaminivorans]KAB2953460.1 phosphonate C-P lyase system protein PhnH [Heliorestis acidaminivorans]